MLEYENDWGIESGTECAKNKNLSEINAAIKILQSKKSLTLHG